MKKVAVITECRRFMFNYGETLQAVALNRAISKLGYKCITASYESQRNIFHGWFKRNIKEYGVRGLRFELFRLRNMKYPIVRSDKKERFARLLEEMDAAVCGSDCIWYEKCYNDIFFLDFPKNKIPKIAYAPSLRDDVITKRAYERDVSIWTKAFSFLSTRERAGSKLIEKLSGKKVETVLDPTFLLRQEEWNKMSAKRLIEAPYIIMYVIGRSSHLRTILSQVQKQYPDRKFLWITMEANNGYPIGEGRTDWGPAEFISLIRYADAVITDSFHGTAFSIIYQKQFYAVKRIVDARDRYDHDCRIRNILELLGIDNYFLPNDRIDFENSHIDYSCVNEKLLLEKKKSIRYLKNALKNSMREKR